MGATAMKPLRPGERVWIRDQEYKIVATNHEGKLILAPMGVKESSSDMMMRLQSTVDEPSTARVRAPEPE